MVYVKKKRKESEYPYYKKRKRYIKSLKRKREAYVRKGDRCFDSIDMPLVERRWISYEAAKIDIAKRSCGRIKNKHGFHKWHEWLRPCGIPKTPEMVYKDEWTDWNDFLGLDNVYDGYDKKIGRKFVSFLEAVRHIQTLGYNNILQYKREVRNGNIDLEVPLNPEVVYKKEWLGWPHYLGKSIHSRLVTKEKMEKLLMICTNNLHPAGYVELVICEGGRSDMEKLLEGRPELRVLKVYIHEMERMEYVRNIMNIYGVERGKNLWLCSNVNEVVFSIGEQLMFWIPPNT